VGFYAHWKSARFLLVAEIERIACLHHAEVYPLWYRSIDLSTDPGLKSHLITFPSSKGTAVSIITFLQLECNGYTNHINHKKMSSYLIAST
jgi:hypothetical protein